MTEIATATSVGFWMNFLKCSTTQNQEDRFITVTTAELTWQVLYKDKTNQTMILVNRCGRELMTGSSGTNTWCQTWCKRRWAALIYFCLLSHMWISGTYCYQCKIKIKNKTKLPMVQLLSVPNLCLSRVQTSGCCPWYRVSCRSKLCPWTLLTRHIRGAPSLVTTTACAWCRGAVGTGLARATNAAELMTRDTLPTTSRPSRASHSTHMSSPSLRCAICVSRIDCPLFS